jgi:hypothetical protein
VQTAHRAGGHRTRERRCAFAFYGAFCFIPVAKAVIVWWMP